jgi:CHAD domain-containing protein
MREYIDDRSADELSRQRNVCHAEVARALQSDRYRRMIESAADWVGSGAWRDANTDDPVHFVPISVYASRTLRQWCRRILRKSRDLTTMDAEARHRLRIRTKRVRYAMEWFGEFLPGSTPEIRRATLKHLRRVQRSLGELNDAARAEALIAQHGVIEPHGERFRASPKRHKQLLRSAQSAFQGLAEIFDAD